MISRHVINDFFWIDLSSPTKDEIKSVADEFNLDHSISEDFSSPTPKPRFYESGKMLFAIFHIPAFKHSHSEESQEIDFLVGRNFAITTRYVNIDALYQFEKEAQTQEILGKANLKRNHIFFNIMQTIQKTLFDELAYIEDWLESIEVKIFEGEEKQMVLDISKASKNLINFRKTINPHKDTLEFLKHAGEERFGPAFKDNLDILIQNWRRIDEIAKNHSDMLSELRETNNSLLSTKQNETMRILAIISFIMFPLTLIAAIFQMNTSYLPFVGIPGDFWYIIGLMCIVTISMFIYFRHKKWI